jgi:hypothetical protein
MRQVAEPRQLDQRQAARLADRADARAQALRLIVECDASRADGDLLGFGLARRVVTTSTVPEIGAGTN